MEEDRAHVPEKMMRFALQVGKASGMHYLGEQYVEIPIVQKVMFEMKIRDLAVDARFVERDIGMN